MHTYKPKHIQNTKNVNLQTYTYTKRQNIQTYQHTQLQFKKYKNTKHTCKHTKYKQTSIQNTNIHTYQHKMLHIYKPANIQSYNDRNIQKTKIHTHMNPKDKHTNIQQYENKTNIQ